MRVITISLEMASLRILHFTSGLKPISCLHQTALDAQSSEEVLSSGHYTSSGTISGRRSDTYSYGIAQGEVTRGTQAYLRCYEHESERLCRFHNMDTARVRMNA
jgi:hypothetical protein